MVLRLGLQISTIKLTTKNLNKKSIELIKSKYNGEAIFFQGSKDTSVPYDYNNRFLDGDHFQNLRIIIVKDADHSLSDIKTLKIIEKEF